MNVYIKQLTGSAICRLASKPRGNSTVQRLQCNSSAIKTQHRTTEKIHCFSPTPQRDTTECHIQSSPHTMSAPVTPLEEGIFGVGHITQACCNQTPSQLSMFKKSQLGGDPFFFFTFTTQHNHYIFNVQLLADACRSNIKSATSQSELCCNNVYIYDILTLNLTSPSSRSGNW